MNKLIKVTLEFEDIIKTLKGKEADNWLKELNAMCIMSSVRGVNLSEYNWNIKEKKCKK